MKKTLIFLAVIALVGLYTFIQKKPAQPSAYMANPASKYCQKIGGIMDLATTDDSSAGYCTLPDGERIEEWTLYHRDHKG
ncbi:hypothetical protein NG99_22350 [Erwinia typographi]|uniref:Hemolysin n=1 Tax=Erwinia typographi TaxID=371042 RepID=A0A0A3YN69_9GAMM|nr:DUF333 domain-containing protein [Erwinia typographi]KGT88045.1 hypothetical protein NG99_22350 [Erwinia typographi]